MNGTIALLSVTLAAAVLLAAGAASGQLSPAATTASAPASRPAVPALVRGVMTDDIKVLTEVGANSCLLWGPPAKVDAWDKYAAAGQFVFLNSLGNPPNDLFEMDGKKRKGMKEPYCYAGAFGRWWGEHAAVAAAKKPPAICNLVPDEVAWNNPHAAYTFGITMPVGTPFYCTCEACKKAVGELPPVTASRFLADSDAARKFVEYRYAKLAEVVKAAQDGAKAADANFLTYYTLNLREVMALERYPYGVALDKLPQADVLIATCFQPSLDRRGEHSRFIQPMVVKHLLAARPRQGVVPTLAATVFNYRQKEDWAPTRYWGKEVEALLPKATVDAIAKDMEATKMTDDEVILPAISCIGHGAKGVMFFGDDNKEALKKLFAVMKQLEGPLEGATVPGEVVVLCSRQSEDASMLSHAPKAGPQDDFSDAMMQLGCWAQPADRIAWEFNAKGEQSQGFRSTMAVMEALIRQNVPFRLHFMENLQEQDLAEAKSIIVPFCTHIGDKPAAMLAKAAKDGKKLVVYAHRGEMDADGKKRPESALAGQRLTFVDGEATEILATPKGVARLIETIGQEQNTVSNLEGTTLRLKDGGTARFYINWATAGDARSGVDTFGKEQQVTILRAGGTMEVSTAKLETVVQPREFAIVLIPPRAQARP